MIVERLSVLLVATLTLATALGVVYVKHLSRVDFNRLQSLHAERDRMDIEWGRLQLEQSTLTQHARIEKLAYSELDMTQPREPRLVRLAE